MISILDGIFFQIGRQLGDIILALIVLILFYIFLIIIVYIVNKK